MGLLSRSISFVRYTVEGELPENFWEFAAERISRFAFQDIDDTFDEYSIGWVAVDNMFDGSFEGASYAVGDYIVLSMRIDERKVSSSLLKKFSLKEEDRIKKENRAPRLSRGHRQQIKEEVRLRLTKRAMPVPSVYDLCWNLADGTLVFFSVSPKAQSVLEDFFKECFGLAIIMQVPYLTAAHLLNAEEQEKLKGLGPEIFV
jgi:DNA recombination-dependent growth factor C